MHRPELSANGSPGLLAKEPVAELHDGERVELGDAQRMELDGNLSPTELGANEAVDLGKERGRGP